MEILLAILGFYLITKNNEETPKTPPQQQVKAPPSPKTNTGSKADDDEKKSEKSVKESVETAKAKYQSEVEKALINASADLLKTGLGFIPLLSSTAKKSKTK